ncbi:hypothetical protein BH23GEM4_BH23GEM4_17400 [soil metagenome]
MLAADLNPAQLACLELRVAAFRRLPDAELLPFLGVEPSPDRLGTYEGLRTDLGADARAFWDAQQDAVAGGIVHAGRFERFLRLFGRRLLPLVHRRRTIRALREPRPLPERRRFYAERWDTRAWRMLFRVFASRFVLGRLGRDPALFAHVEGGVAERILVRTRHALTEIPTHDNPYLAYILTGNFPPEALPRYLRPEHRPTIRARLHRLRWRQSGIDGAGEGPWDGFNLSDIWEYMDRAEHARVYGALVRSAVPGARLVYWNLLAPRGIPPGDRERVRPLAEVAARLHATDRAWFYGALHVDQVRAGTDSGLTAGRVSP